MINSTSLSSPNSVALITQGVQPTALGVSSVAFGNVALNETSASKAVTLYNFQSTTLGISSITVPSQYLVSGGTCGTTLAAQTSCTILLTVTPTVLGAQPGTLTVNTNAPNSPLSATLSATALEPTLLSVSSVAFGNVPISETSATKTVTLYNFQPTALGISSISAPSPYLVSGGTCGSTLAAGTNCTILLTVTPTAVGAQPGTLTVATNAPNSPLSATLSATGLEPTLLSVNSVAFGNVYINETSASKTVTLYNFQLTALGIGSISAPSPYLVSGGTCGSTLAAQTNCTILLTVTPTVSGAQPGDIDSKHKCAQQPADSHTHRDGTCADAAFCEFGCFWQRADQRDQREQDGYALQLPADGAGDHFDQRAISVFGFRGDVRVHAGGPVQLHHPADRDAYGPGQLWLRHR